MRGSGWGEEGVDKRNEGMGRGKGERRVYKKKRDKRR